VDPKRSGTYRAAMAAVILLSALVAAALIALAVGLARQYRLYQADQPAAASMAAAAAGVTLAPGARIVSATADAGKLVLHVQTPRGGEVDVFDLATGKLTSQVKEDGQVKDGEK
jgi:hypothetical protein